MGRILPFGDKTPTPPSEPLGGDGDDELERQLEARMLALITGDRFERLGAIAHEHLFTGAPKPRGELTFAVTRALEVSGEPRLGWAAACALLHSASLIHDDVQDASRFRRGAYSVWVRHGAAQAINAGDLMLMLPNLAIAPIPVEATVRWELSLAASRRAIDTVRGQSLEMCLMSSHRRDWASYEEAVQKKTSTMLALPVQGTALLAGWDVRRAETVAKRFEGLGLLRQLVADVLDLYGNDDARRGAYVREGRISGLVIEHLARWPEDLTHLGPLLGRPADETPSSAITDLAERMDASGARSGVLERIADVHARVVDDALLAEVPPLHAVARQRADRELAALGDLLPTPT